MTSHASSVVDLLRESVASSWRASDMPAHLRHTDGSFRNARGQALSCLALFPPLETPLRGVIVCVHGLGVHARRHFHVYEQLCEAGFGAVAYDLLGHGESDSGRHGVRAHAEKFRYFVDDTNEFVAFVKRSVLPEMLAAVVETEGDVSPVEQSAASSMPFILLGASYGTLIVLHTLLSEKHAFAGAVLVAPSVSVEWRPLLRVQALFARPMSALVPKLRVVPAVKPELLCRDPAYLEDFYNDPLTMSDHMTMRMGEQSLRACSALEKEPHFLDPSSAFCRMPVLFLMGSDDKVASVPAAVAFFHMLRSADKTFHMLAGMFHALFDDPEKDEVFDKLLAWLHARFPERQSPPRTPTPTHERSGADAAAVATDSNPHVEEERQ